MARRYQVVVYRPGEGIGETVKVNIAEILDATHCARDMAAGIAFAVGLAPTRIRECPGSLPGNVTYYTVGHALAERWCVVAAEQ